MADKKHAAGPLHIRISVAGPRASGKTTLLRELQAFLEERGFDGKSFFQTERPTAGPVEVLYAVREERADG